MCFFGVKKAVLRLCEENTKKLTKFSQIGFFALKKGLLRTKLMLFLWLSY